MGVLIRPMTVDDLPRAQQISSAAFLEVDRRTYQRAWPEPQPRPPHRAAAWTERTAHLLSTDPGGCWVADQDGAVVGFAASMVRELMWILSSFAVDPAAQRGGFGRLLLDAARTHGRGCLRGMFNASQDPGALRLYRLAGFDLVPQMLLWGPVSRSVLPVVRHVRAGVEGDRDLLDSLDRRTRGAAHGPDHAAMGRSARLLVIDRAAGSGYAYVDPAGAPVCLAATDRRAASALVWEGLAASDPGVPVEIPHVSPANTWALDVATAARLSIYTRGLLALRNVRDPAPYLPHPSLL